MDVRRYALSALLVTALHGGASAQLRVGASRVDITPPEGGLLYGYGARGDDVSVGVHDRLWARAIVGEAGGERVAIVTLDLGSFEKDRTKRVREGVRRATGITNVILVSSHTHSAPTRQDDFPTSEEPYHLEAERLIVQSIEEAAASLGPARLAVGWGRVEEGHNRRRIRGDGSVFMLWGNREREPTEPLDHSLGVVALDTPEGEPIATLVNFACHPVVLGPGNLRLSADFPGAMVARLAETVGGQTMFLQGAAGDINPFWDKTDPADGAFEQARLMGEAIADEVARVRAGLQPSDVQRLSVVTEEIRLDPRWDLEDPEVEAAFRANEFGWIFERNRARFREERDAEINTVLFDDVLALGTFPGEFFVEHGLRFKQQSMIANTFFVGYTNGALAYFPTIKAAAEGGYGGKEATLVEVGAGDKLVNRALVNLHTQLGRLHRVPQFGG